MKSFIRSILCLSVAVMLSACETGAYHHVPNWTFWKSDHEPQTPDLVQTRLDSGPLTQMPPGYTLHSYPQSPALGNPSVEVFDFNEGPQMVMNAAPAPMPVPAYLPPVSGTVLSGDPSVTIFTLDGAPAPMGMVDNIGYMPVGNQMPYFGGGANTQIFFKHGSSRLGSGDKRKLSSAADQAKFAPVNRVTVAGYASPPTQAGSNTVEGHVINLKQSMNRAFAVSRQLMRNGVPAEKLKTVSWGATKPTGSNSQDRRVDVVMGEQ